LEPEDSLPCSKEPTIASNPEPDTHEHTLIYNFFKIKFNVIILCAPSSSKWFFPSSISTVIFYAFLIAPMRTTCLVHLILLDSITLIIFGEEYTLRSPSLLGLYILFSTLSSDTLNLLSSMG